MKKKDRLESRVRRLEAQLQLKTQLRELRAKLPKKKVLPRKVVAVCDADGECLGVFSLSKRDQAEALAKVHSANVSEHVLNEEAVIPYPVTKPVSQRPPDPLPMVLKPPWRMVFPDGEADPPPVQYKAFLVQGYHWGSVMKVYYRWEVKGDICVCPPENVDWSSVKVKPPRPRSQKFDALFRAHAWPGVTAEKLLAELSVEKGHFGREMTKFRRLRKDARLKHIRNYLEA